MSVYRYINNTKVVVVTVNYSIAIGDQVVSGALISELEGIGLDVLVDGVQVYNRVLCARYIT